MRNQNNPRKANASEKLCDGKCKPTRKILVLHGSQQTGQLLLGRMEKLQKRLSKKNIEFVTPDGPHALLHNDENAKHLRQWWQRHKNKYQGLELSFEILEKLWNSAEFEFEGILGFSQGARLGHLIALYHASNPLKYFPSLSYIIFVAGYTAPIPDGFEELCYPNDSSKLGLSMPSLHIWGLSDALISPRESRALSEIYSEPQIYEHSGKHFVPVKAKDVDVYEQFIDYVMSRKESNLDTPSTRDVPSKNTHPDEESAQMQQEEVEALNAIFPDEFQMLSISTDEGIFEHPISYQIALEKNDADDGIWPPHPVALHVEYPPTYPLNSAPLLSLEHRNNTFELSSSQTNALVEAMQGAALTELGMPCVLSCVYTAREFFESGAMAHYTGSNLISSEGPQSHSQEVRTDDDEHIFSHPPMLQSASAECIRTCNLQGLAIAEAILNHTRPHTSIALEFELNSVSNTASTAGKGGSWKYCIGLVGKPSAGKSTFFNAATCFARQRRVGDDATETKSLGGATMAPHPFTTIDPNIGYCLVPAPTGSCPEEEEQHIMQIASISCAHGRDSKGRRLLPVLLKDVAGLVPGAYQGRGRGNKFLNDLTDADVLVHVIDASGTADAEGNTVWCTEDDLESGAGSHPLKDLAWIRNELIEWVCTNLIFKWDAVKRRGKTKLSGMFSGYGQNENILWDILNGVEKYLAEKEERDRALDHLNEWDEGDVHRLVSAFLGVRFPMVLALNKSDLPPAHNYIKDVQNALPIHGAHVGVPICARKEMDFVRKFVESKTPSPRDDGVVPLGCWQCLQSAVTLREPILVFPVADMITYVPLPGMTKYAISDASLPSRAMIACLNASGGSSPSLWNSDRSLYSAEHNTKLLALRDVLVMKPGSTVEDVFLVLKRMGALGGEFVRAEAAGSIGEKAKLIPKNGLIQKSNRILKIMTNKRREWQTS